jgi:hypothetical protein
MLTCDTAVVEQGDDVVFARHVGPDGDHSRTGLRACRCDAFSRLLVTNEAERDVIAALGRHERGARPDAATSTGDQHHSTFHPASLAEPPAAYRMPVRARG